MTKPDILFFSTFRLQLGMRELFSINADLRGILETSEPLYVSKVIHKAFLDIDEEGGTAAAATAGMTYIRHEHLF